MAPNKPSNQDVLDALHTLNVGMGAELVSLRAEVDKLNLTITGLSHMLANVVSIVDTQTLAGKFAKSFVQPMPPGAQPLFAGVAVKTFYTEDEIYNAGMPLNASEKTTAIHGHLIDAIKAYRERIKLLTGFVPGLKASKELVEKHVKETPPKPGFDILNPPPLLEMHKQLVQMGKKIDAIKAYRDYTGKVCLGHAGLKEAKDVIDAYVFHIGASQWPPAVSFVTSPF